MATKLENSFLKKIEKAGLDNIEQVIIDLQNSKLKDDIKEGLLIEADAVKNELEIKYNKSKEIVDANEKEAEEDMKLQKKEDKPISAGRKAVPYDSIDQLKKWEKDRVLIGNRPETKTSGIAIIKAAIVMLALIFGASNAMAADEAVLGNKRWKVDNSGDFLPVATNSYTIGSSTFYPSEICLGGSCKASWGSAGVSPFSDNGTIITDTSTGKFDFTLATGVISATGLTAGTADIVLENDQIIDGGTNNIIKFTENSDTLSFSAVSGDDWVIDSTDGGVMFTLTDATDGSIDFQPNNDADDYIQITTTTNQPLINFVGCDGSITAASGAIAFGDENLSTTGTLGAGATTATSFIVGDDTVDVVVDDVLQFASNDEISTIQALGFEAKEARLLLSADEADDATDQWEFTAETGGSLTIANDSTTSDVFVTKFTVSAGGAVATTGDIVMGGTTPAITIGDAGAEDTQVNFDGAAQDFHIALQDATDELEIGYGTTAGTDPRLTIGGGTTATTITIGDAVTAEDTMIIYDGNAVDFHIALDDSDDSLEIGLGGTVETDERITIDGGADATLITLGDAAAFDTILAFDGAAQDFHIGIDDGVDDLMIGLGVTPGTTPAIIIDEDQETNILKKSHTLYTDNKTLVAADCGSVCMIATDGKTFTLPDTTAVGGGCEFTFINTGADDAVLLTVTPDDTTADGIYGTIAAVHMTGTDDGDLTNTKSGANKGDWTTIVSDGVTGWFITGGDGVWAGA